MKAVGPQADRERIRRYIVKAGEAASRIGVEVAVFGSGGARAIPEGWDRPRAEEQMQEWLGMIAEEWQGTGVTLALEPLNRKESNLINSVKEAVELVKDINSPIVRVLADFYHMDEDNEPLETIVEHKILNRARPLSRIREDARREREHILTLGSRRYLESADMPEGYPRSALGRSRTGNGRALGRSCEE